MKKGKKYFDYKMEVNSVQKTMERYFNEVMIDVQRGIPQITSNTDDGIDYTFIGSSNANWTCRNCRVSNKHIHEQC